MGKDDSIEEYLSSFLFSPLIVGIRILYLKSISFHLNRVEFLKFFCILLRREERKVDAS